MDSQEVHGHQPAAGGRLRAAVFLDRDGTLIEDRGHLASPSEIILYPDTVSALRRLQERFLLFIVTNQPGVAEGVITMDQVNAVNRELLSCLSTRGVRFAEVYVCPHRRADECGCIKPKPYFLQLAANNFGVDLSRSFTVGDHPHDVYLADKAGAQGVYVTTGHGAKHLPELPPGCVVTSGIGEAAAWILSETENPTRGGARP